METDIYGYMSGDFISSVLCSFYASCKCTLNVLYGAEDANLKACVV